MAENPLKRPYPTDDLQNGDSNGDGAQKKIRSSDRSPAPQANGATGAKPDVSKIMADARARAAAVAAKLRGTGSPTSSTPDPAISAKPSGISRADELKARVALAMGKMHNARFRPRLRPFHLLLSTIVWVQEGFGNGFTSCINGQWPGCRVVQEQASNTI